MAKDFFCYQNNRFLPASELRVSPWDLGFLRGYGVFDVMPVINGAPFLWEWHFERLERSAAELLLQLPVTKAEYGKILQELIAKNAGERILLRTVLSGGISQDAFTREVGKENFLVLAESFVPLPESIYQEGASVVTLDHVRSLPKVKMTQYVMAIRSLEKRQAAGALETLYVQGGKISECAQSNFFIISDGKIVTTTDNSLLGITQKLICEVLAEELGLSVEIRTILETDLSTAEEAFLTGSNKGIVPIVKIDDHIIGNGRPGPLTARLMESYAAYCAKT